MTDPFSNRDCQLQSSLTCRDVAQKIKESGNSNCQSDTFIKPLSKMVDHGGGGIPQNESEAVEYYQKKMLFCSVRGFFFKII